MRERDGVGRAHAQRTAAREVVQRARDDPEAVRVELAEKRGHAAWQCPVDERLEEDRFGAVLPLVHRDELSEHGVGRLTARTPSLDAPDERLGSAAQRDRWLPGLAAGERYTVRVATRARRATSAIRSAAYPPRATSRSVAPSIAAAVRAVRFARSRCT